MNTINNIWIGLLHVRSKAPKGVLENSSGAYVNVLAMAKNINDFVGQIKNALIELNLEFIEIEDVELLSERKEKFEVDSSIIFLAEEVEQSNEMRFGVFHTYE